MQSKRLTTEKLVSIALLCLCFLGAFAVCCFIKYSDGDDAFFLEQIGKHPALPDFVSYLTKTMNGRITSTVALWFVFKLPLWFWRVANAAMFTLFAFMSAKIIALFAKKEQKQYNYLISALAMFAVIGIGVIGYSCLWITGSVNYLWPLCLALVSVFPLLRFVYRKEAVRAPLWAVCFVCGVYVALAQEQIAVVYMSFLALLFVKYLLDNKKINIPFALITVAVIAGVAILMLSPFTEDRTDRELRWLPEYATMAFSQKLFITAQWLVHSFTHSLRFVLILLWVQLGISFFAKKKYVLAAIPSLFALVSIVPSFFAKALIDVGLEKLDMTKTVKRAPQFSDLSAMQTAMLAFWIAVILITLALLILEQRKQKNAAANILLYLAAFASCAIMLFSPSIYASGERTLFVAGVLLMLLAANLTKPVESAKQEVFFLAQIACCGGLQLFSNLQYVLKMIG